MIVSTSTARAETTTAIDVQLTLLAADGGPLAGSPLRLVLANSPGWQDALAGTRLACDEHGIVRWSTRGPVEHRQHKLPTNFFTQLVSPAQKTDHFAIAAQLPFLGRDWLFVAGVDHFANGTSAQVDGLRVYGADAAGTYSVAVQRDNAGWHFPGVAWPVSDPGYQVANLSAAPTAGGWSLALTLRRLPPVVVR